MNQIIHDLWSYALAGAVGGAAAAALLLGWAWLQMWREG